MTLKLVAVDGDVIPEASLAEEAQSFVDELGSDVAAVISVVVQTDGSLRICWMGDDFSSYELMGLFEAAKLRVFADEAIADE